MNPKPKNPRAVLKNIAILNSPDKGKKKDGYQKGYRPPVTKKLEEIKKRKQDASGCQ